MTLTKRRVGELRNRMAAEFQTLCHLLTEERGELFCLHTTLGLSCLIPGVNSVSQTPIHLSWTGEQRIWKDGSSGIPFAFFVSLRTLPHSALSSPAGFILIPMTFTTHMPSTAQSSTPFWFLPTIWDSYHSAKTGQPPKLHLFCEVSRSPPTADYLLLSSPLHSTWACAITAIKQTLFTNLSTPLDGEPGGGLTNAWQTDQWIALWTIPILGRFVIHGGDRCGNNKLHNKVCTHM